MRNNGVLYLDEFLENNKENDVSPESIENNSFKEIYEIEEYILRKQGEKILFAPEVFYKEEYFPSVNEIKAIKTQKKGSLKNKTKNEKYRPKHIRGSGVMREGLCVDCNLWFRLKTSSYWYHMNFKHGISSNGTKYPEPEILYNNKKAFSKCPFCEAEVALGTNNKSLKYNWYKHFQKEHAKMYE